MNFCFRKDGRAGALALALLAVACQRQPAARVSLPPAAAPVPAAAEPAPPVEPGVSQALAEARKRRISGVAYTLHFTVPARKAEPVAAEELVAFNLRDPRDPLQLDFKAPADRLRSLRVNGRSLPPDFRQEHLVLPAAALRPGRNTVEISLLAGEQSLNRNADYLYTLLVPDRARTVVPVFDQPDLKATLTLTLTVPAAWQAVANAPLADSLRTGATKRLTFAPSDSISTYLFSFAAGKFTRLTREAGGRTMSLLHRETDPAKLRLSLGPIFQLHADALGFMEAYTGIFYPFQKLDFAAIPDFQYGGMEHVGAIDYKASTLFLDQGATQDQVLARSSLVAHETAHMWFGDLVTMRWFNDVWMKEVFANFMADKITQVAVKNSNYDLKFVLDHYPAAYGIDRTAGANPIRQPLANLQEAGSLYGNIIYHKAPIMMRQLERLMGPEAFQQGLREYLKKYARGNATWPDLIDILDARTPADLQAWNQVWVNQPGRPVFSYRSLGKDGMFYLQVEQQAEDGSARLWPQEFEVLLSYSDRPTEKRTVKMTKAKAVLRVSGPPSHIIFNSDGLGYGVFPVAPELLPKLTELPNPVTRASAYVNLYENMLNGQALTPPQLLDVCRRALPREPEELNLKLLTGQVSDVFWHFLSPAQRQGVGKALERELWAAMQKTPAANAKKLFFKAYQSVALTQPAQARLYQIWQTQRAPAGVKLTEDDYTALALALAVRDYPAPPTQPILTSQLARITNVDRRQRLQFLLPALAADAATRDAFFASLKDEKNREKEAWVTAALTYLHHPLRQAASEKYLPASLELLEEIQRTGDIFFPYAWLQATLGAYQSASAARTVRAFAQARPAYNPRLQAKLLQAADDLFRAEKLVR